MVNSQDLLQLEKGFWTEDDQYYRAHVDDACLLAFSEMAGVHSNQDIADMRGPSNWKNVDLREKGSVELSDEAVLITYEVSAQRKSGQPYRAVVTSGYVKREGAWKMAFHQQTPLGAEPN